MQFITDETHTFIVIYQLVLCNKLKIMNDTIKKMAMASLGLAIVGAKKVQNIANEVSDKADFGEKEFNEFVDKLAQEAQNTQQELKNKIKEEVKAYMDQMNYASNKEVEDLKNRVAELEAKLKA